MKGQWLGEGEGPTPNPHGFPLIFLKHFLLLIAILNFAAPRAFALNPFQESAGQVVMEAENFDAKIPRNGKDWSLNPSSPGTIPPSGYSGTGYLQALPNTGTLIETGYATTAPELQYRINFTTTGTYYIWIRGRGPTTNDDSLHAGIDGTAPTSADRIGSFPNSWTWMRTTLDGPAPGLPATVVVGATGIRTFNLWMREDGFIVDKILLRKDSSFTAPSGTGPVESPRVGVNRPPVINSVSPAEGTPYYEQNSVTITVTASDADGDSLQYRFLVNGTLLKDWSSSNTATYTASFGKKTITTDVKDPYGGTATTSVKIFVFKRPIGPP